MSEKRRWILILGGGTLLAAVVAGLIYLQYRTIDGVHQAIATLDSEIASGKRLIAKTPEIEREVIMQRETDEVIAEILPDVEDINNFVRTLRTFEEQSGVQISSLKETGGRDTEKKDFDKVGYTLQLNADAFQLLSFLDLIESHARFMRVPGFKLQSSRRSQLGKGDVPRHSIQIDVETYVYEPKTGSKDVKIEGYERKRDLLSSEITRRRSEMAIPVYEYRGPRSRRDPWVDPRIPVSPNDGPTLSIEQQIALVEGLVERIETVRALWEQSKAAQTLIEEIKSRSALDAEFARLDDDVRRVEAEGQLRYVPSERRFQKEVVVVLKELREQVASSEGGIGPSADLLREVIDAMRRHLIRGEHQLALAAFDTIEPRLDGAERDAERAVLVEELRKWEHVAFAFRDFEKIELSIRGVAIQDGREPVAVINGRSVGRGELLDGELLVHDIYKDEIEFLYRGVLFSKSLVP